MRLNTVPKPESIAPPTSLALLQPGRRARVAAVHGGRGCVQRLTSLGILPRSELELIQNGFSGPLIVRVREARVALGRGVAHHVLVNVLA